MFIQFIIVKKQNVIEYFEYLMKQKKAPTIPQIALKNRLLDNKGLANPKTKKWEWNRFLASEVLTIIESLMIPKLSGSWSNSPAGTWFQGIVNLSKKDNLHSIGHKAMFNKYSIVKVNNKYKKNFILLLLFRKDIARSKGKIFIKPKNAKVAELKNRFPLS